MATKKQRFEIKPHVGIGPVRLGMTRLEVDEEIFAEEHCETRGDMDFYFNNAFHVEYSPLQRVSYIEAYSSDEIAFVFEGVDVHKVSANKLLAHIIKFDQPHPAASEKDHYPLFPKLALTLGERRRGPSRWDAVGIGDQEHLASRLERLEDPFERHWPEDARPNKTEAKVVDQLNRLAKEDELGGIGIDERGRVRRVSIFYAAIKQPLVDDDFKQFAKLKWLEALATQAQHHLTAKAIAHISGLTRLKALRISATSLDDKILPHLVKLSALTELALPERISARGMKELLKLKHLHTLDLKLLPGAEAGLEQLCRHPRIRNLSIRGALSNDAMKWMPNFSKLEKLDISDTLVTATGLKSLKGCPSLRELTSYFTVISPKSARNLRKTIPHLKVYPYD